MLAEGRIKWAFWPPDTPSEAVQAHQEPGTGIWMPHSHDDEVLDISDSEDEAHHAADTLETDDDETLGALSEYAYEESDEESGATLFSTRSRFAALDLGFEEDDESDEEGVNADILA